MTKKRGGFLEIPFNNYPEYISGVSDLVDKMDEVIIEDFDKPALSSLTDSVISLKANLIMGAAEAIEPHIKKGLYVDEDIHNGLKKLATITTEQFINPEYTGYEIDSVGRPYIPKRFIEQLIEQIKISD